MAALLRHALVAMVGFGSAIAVVSAEAQTLDQLMTPGDPKQLLAAFKAICIDPGADLEAQARIASSAPWNLKLLGRDKKIGLVYSAYPLQVVLQKSGNLMECNATSSLPKDIDVVAVAALAASELNVTDPQIDAKNKVQSIRWSNLAGDGRSGTFSLRDGVLGDKVGSISVVTSRGK